MRFLFKRFALLWVVLLVSSIAFANPILNVIPNVTQLLVPVNSQGIITYTVTNNTSKTMNNITIDPIFQSTVNPKSVLLANNCALVILVSGASCTFQVVIQGANQPSNFQIRPRVCAYSNAVCSQPVAANTVNVTIVNPL